MTDPRSTYAWQKQQAKVIKTARAAGRYHPCGWPPCTKPVDLDLPGNLRWGPTVDHTLALADGGHLLNNAFTIMHRSCNVSKENQRRRTPQRNPSRTW